MATRSVGSLYKKKAQQMTMLCYPVQLAVHRMRFNATNGFRARNFNKMAIGITDGNGEERFTIK